MRLRAALAAAVVLGLGGTLAPSHAEEVAAIPASAPVADPAQSTDNTFASSDDAAAPAQTWETLGSGMASWYGPHFRGHRTASGEPFDPSELTAAHRSLPFGTKVRVTNADGDSVIVTINDRGPYAAGRLIDLSQAAARELGITRTGSGRVTIAVLDDRDGASNQ